MSEPKPSTTITVRLPAASKARLEAMARRLDLTVSQLVRRHIRQWIAESRKPAGSTNA